MAASQYVQAHPNRMEPTGLRISRDYKDDANRFDQPRPVAFVVEFLPEPSSLALLTIGGLGLLVSRRRRAA
jgi:hypothetical protein